MSASFNWYAALLSGMKLIYKTAVHRLSAGIRQRDTILQNTTKRPVIARDNCIKISIKMRQRRTRERFQPRLSRRGSRPFIFFR
jgi:hypothetical protein